VTLVAHDFGTTIMYNIARKYPQHVNRLIPLDIAGEIKI